jgi:hypothetical protein
MGIPGDRVTSGKLPRQITEPIPPSCALSEFCDDAQSDRVTADTGQMFTQEVGGSAQVAGGRRADHLDVVTLPVHRPTADDAGGRFGESTEIGDGELEGGIGPDRVPERGDGVGCVGGLLCLAIEGGGLDVCRDPPTVVLDRGTGRGRLVLAGVGLYRVAMHNYQVGLAA